MGCVQLFVAQCREFAHNTFVVEGEPPHTPLWHAGCNFLHAETSEELQALYLGGSRAKNRGVRKFLPGQNCLEVLFGVES